MTGGFEFTRENLTLAQEIVCHYPGGKQASAVLPLLDLAQRQNNNWLSPEAQACVADFLNMPYVQVREVAHFYSMFNLHPVGKYQVRVCRTTPCWLRGADGIMAVCRETLGVTSGQTTPDGLVTLSDIECLGACVNAPVVQVNDVLLEDVTPQKMANVLDGLLVDRPPLEGEESRSHKPACLSAETADNA